MYLCTSHGYTGQALKALRISENREYVNDSLATLFATFDIFRLDAVAYRLWQLMSIIGRGRMRI